MTPKQIIETYTGRWSIETTFQERRAHLGLETTRGRTENTVLRVAPCLFGLYSVVALLYAQLPTCWRCSFSIRWPGKDHAAFSDAISAVRRWLWVEWAFVTHGQSDTFTKLPRPLRELLLFALTQAA
ncbi:MAG: transposase [Pirellulales bacterium]|nr:transposase [Pirellulales bacterium]